MSAEAVQPARRVRTAAPLRLLGDDRLARMAAAGNRAAITTLYERHGGALLRYAGSIVRHQDDAQDVVQTTMANAMVALRRGVPDAPLRPWLFRIAHNEAISALRRRRPTAEFDEAQITGGRGPQQTVEDRERLALLVADLQALPDRQRSALVMRELSGLSHEEIGAALDIPAAKAKQSILEARTSLMEFESGRRMDCAEVRRIVSDRDGRKLRGRTIRAHLRACSNCAALRDAIHTRQGDLAMLAPPVPVGLSAAVLAHLLGDGGTGLAGKAAGTTLLAKVAAGAVVLTTVGTGFGVTEVVRHHDRSSRRPATAAPNPVISPTTGTRERIGTPKPNTRPVVHPRAPRPSVARHRVPKSTAGHQRHSRHPMPPPSPGVGPIGGSPQASDQNTPAASLSPTPVATPLSTKKLKPAKSPRPAKTPRPVEAPKPVKPPRPVKPPKPVRTPRPTRTPKPNTSPRPVKTPDPTIAPGR